MATTPIELRTIPGLTLTADLYALGNDTVVQAGITLTEQTNRSGFYRGNITAAASGWHTLSVKLGTAVIDILDIANLQDTTDLQYARTAGDQSAVQSAAAAAIAAAEPIRANAVEIGGVSVEPADISQDVRDAMELESTSGEDSIDDKLNALSFSAGASELKIDAIKSDTSNISSKTDNVIEKLTVLTEISGIGPVPATIRVLDQNGNPVLNAMVLAYDSGVLSGKGTTNENGEVTLGLSNAIYDIILYHTGYSSSPKRLTVSAPVTVSYSIEMITLSGSNDQDWCYIYAYIYNENGQISPETEASIRIIKEPTGSGGIFSGKINTVKSDDNGLVSWSGDIRFPVGCQIEYWRGPSEPSSKNAKKVTVSSSLVSNGVFWLPKIVGGVEES